MTADSGLGSDRVGWIVDHGRLVDSIVGQGIKAKLVTSLVPRPINTGPG